MQARLLLAAVFGATLAAADSVIGVYVFHRHGDRTAKAWQPVNLTSLGADEVFASGSFFRRRYVASDADSRISHQSPDQAVLSQLSVTSPVDNVLHSSALVFLQGLYPPSTAAGAERLANGSTVEAPLGGYQYVPVNAVGSGSGAGEESASWLQGASGCDRAVTSSNAYLQSAEYKDTLAASRDFYRGLLPVVNTTFNASRASFLNAYAIFDLVNVASIHNASIPAADLLTPPTLASLYDLASTHEWNLAFNASDPVRAVSGAVLAGQILAALGDIVAGRPAAPLFNIQFGAYGAFMSFFGLAQLPAASSDFLGICDYASSMVFELRAPEPTGYSVDDVSVRFYFSNGTATDDSLRPFPLFGQGGDTLRWNDFKAAMSKFAVADTKQWCQMCGNSDGVCVDGSAAAGGHASAESTGSGRGLSRPVAGVIGALVTLVVILAVQAAVLLLGGLRLVKKSSLGAAQNLKA